MCNRRHNPYTAATDCDDIVVQPNDPASQLPESARSPTSVEGDSPTSALPAAQMNMSSTTQETHYVPAEAGHLLLLSTTSIPDKASHRSDSNANSSSRVTVPFSATSMRLLYADGAPPFDADCLSGSSLTLYNGDISQHFEIPSEAIKVTKGALKYAEHHERFGSHTRFRFQLCNKFLQGKCERLSECPYVHAQRVPPPSIVHLNPFAPRRLAVDRTADGANNGLMLSAQDDPAVADAYETLPAGFTMAVYPPNADCEGVDVEPQIIPSDKIILTAGAVTARRTSTGKVHKARHCAHYQYRRICHLGAQCHFIHSKVPLHQPSAPAQPAAAVPSAVDFSSYLPQPPAAAYQQTQQMPVPTPTMLFSMQDLYALQSQQQQYNGNPYPPQQPQQPQYQLVQPQQQHHHQQARTQQYAPQPSVIFPPPGMALPRAAMAASRLGVGSW